MRLWGFHNIDSSALSTVQINNFFDKVKKLCQKFNFFPNCIFLKYGLKCSLSGSKFVTTKRKKVVGNVS